MMTQIEINALSTVVRQLPAIASELRKMNQLKAIELKLKFHASTFPEGKAPDWVKEVDDIIDDDNV